MPGYSFSVGAKRHSITNVWLLPIHIALQISRVILIKEDALHDNVELVISLLYCSACYLEWDIETLGTVDDNGDSVTPPLGIAGLQLPSVSTSLANGQG